MKLFAGVFVALVFPVDTLDMLLVPSSDVVSVVQIVSLLSNDVVVL
jgi:hypothetical protein